MIYNDGDSIAGKFWYNDRMWKCVSVRTVDVEAVEGKVAEFPCDINSGQHDKVHIVFWFKDDAGIPLYRYNTLTCQSIDSPLLC